MDYEKKYKEAFGRASYVKDDSMVATPQEVAEYIFPELADSEDERTRKEILDYIIKGSESFYDVQQYGKERFEKWIAWLEKQGEEKKEPKFKVGDTIKYNGVEYKIADITSTGYKVYCITYDEDTASTIGFGAPITLVEQKQWKPTERMLEALYRCIPENVMAISEDEMLLDKLYQGLKYGRVLSKN